MNENETPIQSISKARPSCQVTSVCLPTACMVVAGCSEGELALWDLRETSAVHHQLREEEEEGVLRRAPTYVSQGSHASKVRMSLHLFHSFRLYYASCRWCQCDIFKMEKVHRPLSQRKEVYHLLKSDLLFKILLSPRPGCLPTGLSGDPRQGGSVDGVGHSEGLHHPAGTCSLGPGGNDLGGQSDADGNWMTMFFLEPVSFG